MQYPITDDLLHDPGDEESGDGDDLEDKDEDSIEGSSTSTSTQPTGRLERPESLRMLPSGDASQTFSQVDDACTTTMDAEPCNNSDEAACKAKRTIVGAQTACGLEIPTISLTVFSTSIPQTPLDATPTTSVRTFPTRPVEGLASSSDTRFDIITTCDPMGCDDSDLPHRWTSPRPLKPLTSVSALDVPTASITAATTLDGGARLEKSVAVLDVPTVTFKG